MFSLYSLSISYADWCGACQRFKPHLLKSAAHLKNHNVTIGIINFDKNIGKSKTIFDTSIELLELSARFLVTRLPSIFYIKNKGEEVKAYDGTLSHDGLISYFPNDSMVNGDPWELVPDIPTYISPLSPVGSALALFGSVGALVLQWWDKFRTLVLDQNSLPKVVVLAVLAIWLLVKMIVGLLGGTGEVAPKNLAVKTKLSDDEDDEENEEEENEEENEEEDEEENEE